jgi:hypothetical protein
MRNILSWHIIYLYFGINSGKRNADFLKRHGIEFSRLIRKWFFFGSAVGNDRRAPNTKKYGQKMTANLQSNLKSVQMLINWPFKVGNNICVTRLSLIIRSI